MDKLPSVNYYKDNYYYEVSLSLFDRCNLNCDFCFQDRTSKIDIDSIYNIPDKLIEFLPRELKRTNSHGVLIRLWGGEIFADSIPDEMFDVYENLVNDIKSKVNIVLPGIEILFVCTTNGVFRNHKRVKVFLDKINSDIAMSYDPYGRFKSNKQLEMFLKTFEEFKNKVTCMAITLTKPALEKFIKGDEIFNRFADNLTIDMNYYVANEGWEIELPSDDDLYNFFKWSIDSRKFNITDKIINGFMFNNKECVYNSCICYNFALHAHDEFMNDCVKIMSEYPLEDFYGEYSKDVTWGNSSEMRATLGFIKRGCLYCEHKTLCSGMCWCGLIYKNYKLGECPIGRLYTYIEKDSRIKDDYINWVNTSRRNT